MKQVLSGEPVAPPDDRVPHAAVPTHLVVILSVTIGAVACGGGDRQAVPAVSESAPETGGGPLHELPYTPGLDLTSMDRTVDPCRDFYAYSCGGWIRNNPIPSDRARFSVYGKLYLENQRFLWGILERAAATVGTENPATQHPTTPVPDEPSGDDAAVRKIGAYFRACMDEGVIERRGAAPLEEEMASISALGSTAEIARYLGGAQLATGDSGLLFGLGSEQDYRDSTRVIPALYSGGLGLPDRDYYVSDEGEMPAIRREYLGHVERTLRLIGYAPEAAAAAAADIMRIETALARATLTRVEQRDPEKLYHPMAPSDLRGIATSFRWKDYLAAAGLGVTPVINVTEPAFFRAIGTLLAAESLETWKTYLRWRLADERAANLSTDFVNEDFEFNQRTLRGVEEIEPRWKRCVGLVDRDLGEALGRVFVERTFSPEAHETAIAMVRHVEAAMKKRIEDLTWMGATTKEQALLKLARMRNKIGYPDRWRDYSALRIAPDDFAGNVRRSIEFESRRQLDKIGKPVDRGEWYMTPPTVNAYYDAQLNDINFAAGVLQPPLLDLRMDAAPGYGDTGSTIGHELTHGFDDEGRKFDADGNLRDWWTPADAEEFEKRVSCIADQYAGYVVVEDIRINSRLTLGEDVADLGGTILAWEAWKEATAGLTLEPIDGLTPEQRFFVGFAQWACGSERDESKRVNAVTSEHSPPEYRINGVVVNMPEFARAFSCDPSSPMVKKEICSVW